MPSTNDNSFSDPGSSQSINIRIPDFQEVLHAGKSLEGVLSIVVAAFTTELGYEVYKHGLDHLSLVPFALLSVILIMFIILATQNQVMRNLRIAGREKRKILEEHLPALLNEEKEDIRKFFDKRKLHAIMALYRAPDQTLKALDSHLPALISTQDLEEIDRFFQHGRRSLEIDRLAYQLIGDWMIKTVIRQGQNKDIIKQSGGRCRIRKGGARIKISGVWFNEDGVVEGNWHAIHVIINEDVFQFEFEVPMGPNWSHMGKMAFSDSEIVRNNANVPIAMSGTWGIIGGDYNGHTEFTRMPLATEDELKGIEQHRSRFHDKNEDIHTLKEEVRAFRIVLDMLKGANLNINRVFYKDTPDFFQVMVDDSDGLILCRFYFNGLRNLVWISGEEAATKYSLNGLADLEKYEDKLLSKAIKMLTA